MRILFSFLLLSIAFPVLSQVNQVDGNGKKQGVWEKVYEGSKVYKYRGQFKNDKPIGKFTYYYKSSKVKAIIIHDDNSSRSVGYFYHTNSALMSSGIYRDMKKDSIWINFGPSQKVSSTETYKNDKLHGLTVVYYVPPDPHDKSQIPHEKLNYVDGELNGTYTSYFLSGLRMETGEYVHNKKDGFWESFHQNGKRRLLTHYVDGVKHGWTIAYDEQMKRIAENYYYYGKLLKGEALEIKLKQLEELGVDPNGN